MNDKLDPSMEDEVWNAIQACEQILEAIPNDRHALRTLSNAYEQIGDVVQAKDYAMRLGEVLIAENDVEAAAEHRQRILPFADDPVTQTMLQRLDEMSPGEVEPDNAAAPAATPTAGQPPADAESGFDVTTEIAVAWSLREADLISEEEYSEIVDDLTKLSAENKVTTVSVLHVMNARGANMLEKVIATLAREHDCPIVDPRCFHITHELASLLPLNTLITRGVLPFERMGETILVGLMNPMDRKLREEITMKLERTCHFYLLHPAAFDESIEVVSSMIESGGAGSED